MNYSGAYVVYNARTLVEKNTPLHFACNYASTESIMKLLEIPGIDVDELNGNGGTPLIDAASW